jgi:prolipoprotein diacylglyceryltransferase
LAGLAAFLPDFPTRPTVPYKAPLGSRFRGRSIAPSPQLYEIAFLLVFSLALWAFVRQPHNGDVFKLFIAGYMGWRFLIDFLKPEFRVLGLSVIQWTCLIVFIYYETVRILRTIQHARLNTEVSAE